MHGESSQFVPHRIVSGGQTGVDQGALLAAIELDIDHGGWCPRGRRCESGRIPPEFQLAECASGIYAVRTERNVLDSDGTLIVSPVPLVGGTELTRRFAQQHGKPCLTIDINGGVADEAIHRWLAEHKIRVLNIAGPRESSRPGIRELTTAIVLRLFRQ